MTTTDLEGQAATVRQQHADAVRSIRGDQDLTDDARRRLLREADDRAGEQLEALRRRADEDLTAAAERARAELWGPRVPVSATVAERTAIQANTRQAAERAEQLRSPTEARTLLRRALELRDSTLARQVARVAHRQGWRSVVIAWAEAAGPDDRRRLDALADAQAAAGDKRGRLAQRVALGMTSSSGGR